MFLMCLRTYIRPRARGYILFEAIMAMALLSVGAGLFILHHPDAVKTVKQAVAEIYSAGEVA